MNCNQPYCVEHYNKHGCETCIIKEFGTICIPEQRLAFSSLTAYIQHINECKICKQNQEIIKKYKLCQSQH